MRTSRPAPGTAPSPGRSFLHARILAASERDEMWRALVAKYGIPALAFRLYDRIRGLLRLAVSAGIEVSRSS